MVLGDPQPQQLLLQGLSTATLSNLPKLDFSSEKLFAAATYPQSIGRLTLRFEKATNASVRKMDLYLCYLQKPRRERQTERHVNFLPHSPQILFLNVSKHVFPHSRTSLTLTLEHSQQHMRLF